MQGTKSALLIIFLKYPQAGKVKTRLAKEIGRQNAAGLYRVFVEVVLKRTKDKNFKRLIFYAPRDKGREIKKWLGNNELEFHPQKGKDLGERLCNAFQFAFNQPSIRKVVAIGTDSPLIDRKVVTTAFNSLETKQCVLGPAIDGGYYLIGLSSFSGHVFKGIHWGTKKVLSQTIRGLRESKINHRFLKVSCDIDTHDDLRIFMKMARAAKKINLLGLAPIFDILNEYTLKAKKQR